MTKTPVTETVEEFVPTVGIVKSLKVDFMKRRINKANGHFYCTDCHAIGRTPEGIIHTPLCLVKPFIDMLDNDIKDIQARNMIEG